MCRLNTSTRIFFRCAPCSTDVTVVSHLMFPPMRLFFLFCPHPAGKQSQKSVCLKRRKALTESPQTNLASRTTSLTEGMFRDLALDGGPARTQRANCGTGQRRAPPPDVGLLDPAPQHKKGSQSFRFRQTDQEVGSLDAPPASDFPCQNFQGVPCSRPPQTILGKCAPCDAEHLPVLRHGRPPLAWQTRHDGKSIATCAPCHRVRPSATPPDVDRQSCGTRPGPCPGRGG